MTRNEDLAYIGYCWLRSLDRNKHNQKLNGRALIGTIGTHS